MWAVALGLTLLAFLTFLPVLRCGFTDFDDPAYVSQNPRVQTGLSAASIQWALTDTSIAYWQPLSLLSLMLDSTINGTSAFGYHRTNLLIHALSAGVAFLVLFRMTGAFWRSALIAALYAVHPLRIESVAWIAERKDVLSNLFAWITIGGYVYYSRAPSARRYLWVLIPFALGLLAKPMIVTLPCLLLLLDYWPLRRWSKAADLPTAATAPAFAPRPRTKLIAEKLPLFLLSLAAGISALIAQRQCSALVPLARYPIVSRLGNGLIGYSMYLWKMVWFTNLAVFYPLPQAWTGVQYARLAVAIVVLGTITVIALINYRRRPWLVVGWLWFLGVLSPVSGIFQAGPQLLADRFSYLPSVGLLVMLIFSIPAAVSSLGQQRLRVGCTVATLAFLCTFSWLQCGYWHDTNTLFSRAIAVTTDNWLAHDQLGLVAYRNNDTDRAVTECREALRINPIDSVANFNLGIVYSHKGDDKTAVNYFNAALAAQPTSPQGHADLGVALEHLGDFQGAYEQYKTAAELSPDYGAAHSDLGGLFARIGMADAAVKELRLALSLWPADEKTRMKLINAEVMLRQKASPTVAGAAEAGQ